MSFEDKAQLCLVNIDVSILDPIIHTDSLLLKQVLCNLLSNSNKYTPGGGYIIISLYKTETRLTISVEDDGYGIPADEAGKYSQNSTVTPM